MTKDLPCRADHYYATESIGEWVGRIYPAHYGWWLSVHVVMVRWRDSTKTFNGSLA